MTPLEAFSKLSTEAGASAFCSMVSSREIANPFTKSEWTAQIQYQADNLFKDAGLSPQQKFSRYCDTPIGAQMLYCAKISPAHTDYDDATTIGTDSSNPNRGSSQPRDRAYDRAASALERGRSARDRAAMILDVTPRGGDEEPNQGDGSGASLEARTRAARRHALDGSKSFERHHADVLRDDPSLTQRVLAEERGLAKKRAMDAGYA